MRLRLRLRLRLKYHKVSHMTYVVECTRGSVDLSDVDVALAVESLTIEVVIIHHVL